MRASISSATCEFSRRNCRAIVYLGVISTALAMYLWNKSLQLLEAGVVSVLFFAQPVVGVGLGALLLDEQLSGSFWLGAALIGAGVVLAARPVRGTAPAGCRGKAGPPALER